MSCGGTAPPVPDMARYYSLETKRRQVHGVSEEVCAARLCTNDVAFFGTEQQRRAVNKRG